VPREAAIEAEGRIVEALPNGVFRVQMPNGHRILAYLSGKMRLNFIRLDAGDAVRVEMSPFDLSKGCIISKETVSRI
jgi:translation initiation factor IF-1